MKITQAEKKPYLINMVLKVNEWEISRDVFINRYALNEYQGVTEIISTLVVYSTPLLKYRETEGIKGS